MMAAVTISIKRYFDTLTKMLGSPREYFGNFENNYNFAFSLTFLVISSIFCAVAGVVSNMSTTPLITGGILLINGIGMTLISAVTGFTVAVMLLRKNIEFKRFLSVYALSGGTVLLAAWMPYFFFILEPWKWWLIGTGMTRGCGFRTRDALIIISVSIAVIIALFTSVLPALKA